MSTRLLHLLAALGVVVAVFAGLATAGCHAPQSPAALTIAATATSHEPAPSTSRLSGMLGDHARAALYPGDGAVTVLVQGRQPVTVDLTPMRGDQVESNPTDKLINEAIGKVDPALAAGAGTDGLDTLKVYDQALQVSPAGSTIAMITSGLSTVAPVDLTQAGDWIDNPDQFVRTIRPADLPDASGRNVIWYGLGYADPAGVQASADPAARQALHTIWAGICKASHAATCTVIDGPAGTQPATATNSVPTVALRTPQTACVGTTDLSADVLFSSDSPALSPKADQVLAPIAHTLASCPAGTRITAYGHTAQVPGHANGRPLSQARAQNVLDRLRALGAPDTVIGQAIGLGDSQPIVDNMPGGVYDDSLAARNRIVQLVATTH